MTKRMNVHFHPKVRQAIEQLAEKYMSTLTAAMQRAIMETHAREFPPVKMTTAKAYKAAEAAALAERRKASREKLLAEVGPQVALRRGAWVEWLAWFDRSVVDEFDQRMPGWIISSPDISDADELEPKNPQGLHWATVHPNGDPRLPGNRPPLSWLTDDAADRLGIKPELTYAEVAEWAIANPHPQAPVGATVGFGIKGDDTRSYVKRDGPA